MPDSIKIKKLLFATRFHDVALNRLKPLFPLAAAGLEEIVLCHIIRREDVGFVPFGGYMKEEELRQHNEALIRFEDWQASISEAGLRSKSVVEVGEAVPSIISVLHREEAQLMVIGRKKTGRMERALAGSDTMELLRRAPVATLVCGYHEDRQTEGEPEKQQIFELPLLATDFSKASEKTLSFLAGLKGAVKKAAVVHIIPDPARYEELRKEMADGLEKYTSTLRQAGIQAEPHLGTGETPWEAILEKAEEINATLIIAASTRKDRLHELFLGSVSHRLVEHSALPVLLVPD
ncbi:MAG: universal stress protein [Nitrospiraceae bacterium]|nr:universal stress protein [Nitrospiraceae bacterium]